MYNVFIGHFVTLVFTICIMYTYSWMILLNISNIHFVLRIYVEFLYWGIFCVVRLWQRTWKNETVVLFSEYSLACKEPYLSIARVPNNMSCFQYINMLTHMLLKYCGIWKYCVCSYVYKLLSFDNFRDWWSPASKSWYMAEISLIKQRNPQNNQPTNHEGISNATLSSIMYDWSFATCILSIPVFLNGWGASSVSLFLHLYAADCISGCRMVLALLVPSILWLANCTVHLWDENFIW